MIQTRLPRFIARNYAAAFVLAFACAHPIQIARAQVVWNNSGGTTDFNTATNWAGNTLPGTGSIAAFTGAAVVQPNVSANITVSALNFSSAASTGYVLSASGGAVLSLLSTSASSGLAAVTSANSSGTNQITAPLHLAANSGQFILQSGAGTLQLGGLVSSATSSGLAIITSGSVVPTQANTYSGWTSIWGPGSVSVASIGNSGAAGNLGAGTTIELGLSTLSGNLIYTGAGETTNRTVNLNGTTGGASISSSGTGALVFSGNVTVSATAPGAKALTLTGTNSGANAIQGTIVNSTSGATSVVKTGAGAWTLSGTNTYTGGTAINAGTLTLGSSGALGSTGTISFGGGTLQYSASNTTDYSGRFSTAASQAYKIDTNAQNVAFASALTSSGGSLTKSGAGTLTLTGGNTYTGGTTLNHGSLTLGATDTLASTGSVTINETTAAATATLNLGNGFSQQIGALTLGGASGGSGAVNVVSIGTGSTLTLGGNVTYDASAAQGAAQIFGGSVVLGTTVTFDIANGSSSNDLLVGSPMSGSGGLVKTGAGTMSLAGSISGYSGGTVINQGTLSTGAGASRLPSGGNITVNGTTLGTTTSLSLNSSESIGALTFGGTNATATSFNNVNLTTTNTLTLGGNVTYDATNNPAGATITGAIGFVALGGNRAFVVGDSTSAATDLSVAPTITGAFSLTKEGAGTLSLAGTNTYTGGTVINAGTLTAASAGALGSTGTISFGGGTLQHGTAITTDFSGRFSNAASQAYKIDTNGNAVTYATALTSSGGSLTKSGTGTLTLTGANTYGGGTTVNHGTLTLGGNSTLSSAGSVTINETTASSTANLTLSGNITQSIGALTFGGIGSTTSSTNSMTIGTGSTLTLGGTVTYDATGNPLAASITGGTLALGGDRTFSIGDSTTTLASDLAISSAITGAGQSLTKTGAGRLGFQSSANTYDGGTTINGGMIFLNVGGGLSSTGNVTVNNTLSGNATLALGAGVTQQIGALTLGGAGAAGAAGNIVSLAGNATLNLVGTLTYDATNNPGGAFITSGTLGLGNARTIAVGNSSTATDLTITSIVTGSGGLTKTGAGFLSMAGNATYTGGTFVNDGTLFIGANTGLPTGGDVTVNSTVGGSAILQMGGTTAATIGALTLGGTGGIAANNSVAINGTAALTLGGTLTYDATGNPLGSVIGSTGGTLALGGNRIIAVGNSTNAGATVDLAIYANITGASQSLTKTGDGYLTLSGASTYDGGTIINGGTLQLNATNALASGRDVTVNNQSSGTTAAFVLAGGFNQTIGALTLGGSTTAVGSTSINNVTIATGSMLTLGGTVTYDGTANIGTSNIIGGTLALGGNRTFDVGNSTSTGSDLIVTSVVSGTGSLTKTGAGVLKFSGAAATYTGDTVINGGRIFLSGTVASAPIDNALVAGKNIVVNANTAGGTAALQIDASRGQTIGTLTLGGTGATSTSTNNIILGSGATLTMGGALTYDAAGNPLGSTISGGTLALGATRTFAIGNSSNAATDLAISSIISGTGFGITKTGTGLLELSAANTYTGATTVNGGTLALTGSLAASALTVNTGATLAGAGTAAGSVTLNSGGILAPGSGGLGMMTVESFTWNGGGVMNFELGTANASDKLAITGALAKAGTGFNFDFLTGGTAGNTYTLLTFGSNSGFTSGDLSYSNLASGLIGAFAVNANDVTFSISASAIPEPSTYAAIFGALALAGAAWHRRRDRVRAVMKN
jgi:autotransporter-associated beta strand protein